MIANATEPRKYPQRYPSTVTGVLCSNCFQSIERITLDDGIVGLLCGCYGRLFESGNERYKRLTTKLWHEFIDDSRKKDSIGHAFIGEISEGALNRPLVNPQQSQNTIVGVRSAIATAKSG
jgi:hypothetical protein